MQLSQIGAIHSQVKTVKVKYTKKHLGITLISYLTIFNGYGQHALPLKVGEQFPNLVFTNVINHTQPELRISDFRGKLVILDFWSTWCSVCIAQFPKLDELQKQFGDSIKIITVGFDAKRQGDIAEFVKKRKNSIKALNLPTIIQKPEEKTLIQYFPTSAFPLEVWIDPDGKFIGSTNHLAVTTNNIRDLLKGRKLNFGTEVVYRYYKTSEKLLINREPAKGVYSFGSAFSGRIDSLRDSRDLNIDKNPNYIRFFFIDKTVYDLYRIVYKDKIKDFYFEEPRIVIDDGIQYEDWPQKIGDNWKLNEFLQNHTFCYELILPPYFDVSSAKEWMISDFDKYFGIKSYVEVRNVRCWAIVKIPKKQQLTSDKRTSVNADDDGQFVHLEGVTIDELISHIRYPLRFSHQYYPIVNETNFFHKIDMDIPSSIYDVNKLKLELNKKGFDIVEVKRDLEMLVLKSDRKLTKK